VFALHCALNIFKAVGIHELHTVIDLLENNKRHATELTHYFMPLLFNVLDIISILYNRRGRLLGCYR
jgi:hypothetical protein